MDTNRRWLFLSPSSSLFLTDHHIAGLSKMNILSKNKQNKQNPFATYFYITALPLNSQALFCFFGMSKEHRIPIPRKTVSLLLIVTGLNCLSL